MCYGYRWDMGWDGKLKNKCIIFTLEKLIKSGFVGQLKGWTSIIIFTAKGSQSSILERLQDQMLRVTKMTGCFCRQEKNGIAHETQESQILEILLAFFLGFSPQFPKKSLTH